MNTLIVHHHDLDGYVAGDIARLSYPEAQTLSLNYDCACAIPGPEALSKFDLVIVVDYTLPEDTMVWLKNNRRCIWVDHHISAIKKSIARGYDDMDGLRLSVGESPRCGAELAWEYFVKRPLTKFLKLVGDYDTFRNSHDPEFQSEVMPFFYGTQVVFDRFLPANFHQQGFLLPDVNAYENDEWCNELIARGQIIQAYNNQYYRGIQKEFAFVRNIWGLRVLCMNCAGHGSSNINSAFNPELHDAMMLYSYNGRRWTYGIYTDDSVKPNVDLSAIALQYGGGGHRCAAGFSTPTLLPELQAEPAK